MAFGHGTESPLAHLPTKLKVILKAKMLDLIRNWENGQVTIITGEAVVFSQNAEDGFEGGFAAHTLIQLSTLGADLPSFKKLQNLFD